MPIKPGRVQQRAEAPHPPVHRDVIDLDATLGEQLLHVPIGQAEPQIRPTAGTITSGGKPEPGERRTTQQLKISPPSQPYAAQAPS
jgi:hypothetical protein